MSFLVVAGPRIELGTSWLWIMRSNRLSYPANSIVVIAGAKVRQIIGICKNVLIFFCMWVIKYIRRGWNISRCNIMIINFWHLFCVKWLTVFRSDSQGVWGFIRDRHVPFNDLVARQVANTLDDAFATFMKSRCYLLASKRCRFSVRKVAFWLLKDGLSDTVLPCYTFTYIIHKNIKTCWFLIILY